jgi:type IV secretion system protein VirD4
MFKWRKSRADAIEPPPDTSPNVLDKFPRGLPDGNLRKPIATAQWAGKTDAARLLGPWKPGRFLLGRDDAGHYIGVDDDRHILTVAGSRAGKGVSLIVPNLLTWPGSCIAIDPKGELATLTACRRADASRSEWAVPMGEDGQVYVLDPFKRVTGPATDFLASFNPLDGISPGAEETDEDLDLAGQIADALVLQQQGAGAHWTATARSFLRGLVLYIAKTSLPGDRDLTSIRRLLLQGADGFSAMLVTMGKCGGVIGRAGRSLEAKPKDERASVISTCDVQTDFLEGEAMRSVLAGKSDFRMEDLKAGRVTVYLCLPATRLGTHGRWFRLLINLAIEAMERTGPLAEGAHPVLFCLDEFAALGHMESIEKAAGQIASFGVKLWPIVQDLTQLERDYDKAWQTFMGNAGLLTFFGNTDLFTVEHVSKRLGECETIRTVVNRSESWQRSGGKSLPGMFEALSGQGGQTISTGINQGGNLAASETLMKAFLLNPDEITRLFARESGRVLALIPHPEFPPFVLNRIEYFSKADDQLLGGWFDPVPGKPNPLTNAKARRGRVGEHQPAGEA